MDKISEIIYESNLKAIEIAKRRLQVASEQRDECQKEYDRLVGHETNILNLGWEKALEFQKKRDAKGKQSAPGGKDV